MSQKVEVSAVPTKSLIFESLRTHHYIELGTNVAKIFGELITLPERDKRAGGTEALSVRLPYSKENFSVPSNLHVIATMNTADRSLTQLDIALRRRFEFQEMMPRVSLLEDIPEIEGIHVSSVLRAINERIELLYDREHTIGHSFFLLLKAEASIEALRKVFELQVMPLLEEYFFEDWEKIRYVLGDHLKPAQYAMVRQRYNQQDVVRIMGSDWASDSDVRLYERNDEALLMPEAYIGIYDSEIVSM